jgi:hypothetical protein
MNIEIKNRDGEVIRVIPSDRADLYGASLYGASLYGASLYGASLYGASLYGASLYGASLYGANLSGANLSRTDLRGANLREADLTGADLSWADLTGADLSWADLREANLTGANLTGANFRGASLYGANIADVKRLFVIPAGDLVGWKRLADGTVAKLLIPSAARRFGGVISNKCRAEFAEVLEGSGASIHDPEFPYSQGERVQPVAFDENPLAECSGGIHFFLNEKEAEEYCN